jgi:hypothetical protein
MFSISISFMGSSFKESVAKSSKNVSSGRPIPNKEYIIRLVEITESEFVLIKKSGTNDS